MEHSKLPWKQIGPHVFSGGYSVVRGMNVDVDYVNAAFIVKVCNNHQKLVDALEKFALLNPNLKEHYHFKGLILQAQQTLNEITK